MLGNFSFFFVVCRFFQNGVFRKFLSGISSALNILDPDKTPVWPDLGPNCLPRLSADDTCRQRVMQ